MPPKFFITHSWHDIEFAKQFTDAMRGAGLDGFFDAYSLYPGDVVTAEIQKGLEACDVYVPILSDAALRSPWCEEEINAAITLSKLPGRNGRPRIIPVLVEPVQDRMSIFLRARLFVRFEDNFQHSFQEFWRGVMVTPTQESSLTQLPSTKPPPQNTAPLPAQTIALPTQNISPAPTATEPPAPAPQIETPPRAIATLPRDEMMMLYQDGRAHQNAGDLQDARAAFQKVFDSAPEYRDVSARLTKLDLYLNAQELMERGLADKEDKTTYWEQAVSRLEALLQLDARFLDTAAKLETAKRWIALDEAYERLQDALEEEDWANAFARFQQIQSVKPTYRNTQKLFARAWSEISRAGLTEKTLEPDGKEMLLIPAGEFLMGSNENDAEKPIHSVYLDSFYIARYPVTNAEYKKFVEAAKHRVPQHWQNGNIPNGIENHPVPNVDWNDAAAYCDWLSEQVVDKEMGKQVKFRLPTEAEWEKAASWDFSQNKKRVYPWGDKFDASKCNSQESGIGGTTPVGKYSPMGDSFYGVGDMAGNVSEWCADWYDENYYQNSPRENPRNDTPGESRVLRGGAFLDNVVRYARCAFRYAVSPHIRHRYLGFRVVLAPA